MLSALATCIESDTVSKVKKMIRDLIVKVMEEAKEDASHKGRSDTELSTTVKLMEEANRQDTSSLSSLCMPTLMNWRLSGRQQDSKAGHWGVSCGDFFW